jgi:protocatechuate 3,4-dioxygenase beta subunit
MTRILVPLLLTIVAGPPQQPRDARVSPSGTSRISGIVVTGVRSPQPVRRAIVTIAGSPLRTSRGTITDDAGRFAFDGLPAGRFVVTAARKAYLTSAFGAAYEGDAGTPVTVGEGASFDNVRIVLNKGAVLTGVITDWSGIPIPSLAVTAFRASESIYETPGEDVTDDRGLYRIYGLPPGEYIVGAAPRPTGAGDVGVRSEREVDALLSALQRRGTLPTMAARPGEMAPDRTPFEPQRAYSFAQVYYPGTPVAGEAAKVTVAAGEERGGLDFTITVVPTATIKGVVMGSDGQPVRDIQLSIVPVGPPVTIFATMGTTGPPRTGADGSFSRSGVTPGTYRILVRRVPGAPQQPGVFAGSPVAGRGATSEWAMTEVSVNGEDIDGLSLMLQPGLRLTGRIVFEGTSEIPPDLSVARITLAPVTAVTRTINVLPIPAKADGTVEITNLLPGSYQVGLTLPQELAERWWLRSATSDGRDVLDVPLELTPGTSPDVVFTLSDRRSSLSGRVADAEGRPTANAVVVAFSADRSHWRRESRRIRAARPAIDGAYELTDLPAGEYLVAAVPLMPTEAWRQPAFLEELAAAAVRIVVGDGEQKTLTVSVSRRR